MHAGGPTRSAKVKGFSFFAKYFGDKSTFGVFFLAQSQIQGPSGGLPAVEHCRRDGYLAAARTAVSHPLEKVQLAALGLAVDGRQLAHDG